MDETLTTKLLLWSVSQSCCPLCVNEKLLESALDKSADSLIFINVSVSVSSEVQFVVLQNVATMTIKRRVSFTWWFFLCVICKAADIWSCRKT